LREALQKIGKKRILKISKWWEELRTLGEEHGRAKGDPDWFFNTMKKVKEQHPTRRKLRFYMYCKYSNLVALGHNTNMIS
jgi:hypothetical protein